MLSDVMSSKQGYTAIYISEAYLPLSVITFAIVCVCKEVFL